MHDSDTEGNGRNSVKLAAAIGTTILFVTVVAVQISNHWPAAEAAAKGRDSYGSATDRPDPDRSGFPGLDRLASERVQPAGKWSEVPLSECTRYDPFATPDGFSLKKETVVQEEVDAEALQREMDIAKKRADQERVISSLRDAGVNAVFNGSQQNSAIVGSRTIRVGEELGGFRVLAIESDGIVIERPAIR